MAEKRTMTRHYVIAEVSVKPLKEGSGGQAVGAEAMDVNSGGVGLYLWSALPEGSKVMVSIILAGPNKDDVVTERLQGTVQWVRPVGGRYSAGIRFDERVTAGGFPALSSYILDTEEDDEDNDEDGE